MTSSLLLPPVENYPPKIPAARLDWTGAQTHPLLVWVRTGTAQVYVDGTAIFQLTAGEGAWLPAAGCHQRGIVTEPGTVAFPIWLDSGMDSASAPRRFDVPETWQDWLIQHYNLRVTPFSGRGYSQDAIIDLLRRPGVLSAASPPALAPTGETRPEQIPGLLPLPKARGARAVAEELMREPALEFTIQQWATRVLSSSRTLLRDFRSETGLTFEQWRLRCRLGAAIEYLAAGQEVEHVSTRVGFGSRGGFSHAFKREFGLTPHHFRRELVARYAAEDLTTQAKASQEMKNLVRLVRSGNKSMSAPRLLPALRTPAHANNSHVLSWVYRGSGYLDIGQRRYERQRGVATWIPAEVEHVTGLREESISLPLGDASTGDLHLSEPLQVEFSPAWDSYLMFCSISARSGLKPKNYDSGHILSLFAEQVAAQRALAVSMPADPEARMVALDYLRRLGTSDGSMASDVPAQIHRAFRNETGMTFLQWCYAIRMRAARDLLMGGAKPSAVARRIGYAHLSTFSAAFSRFHALSPREYQEWVVDDRRGWY